MNHEASFLLETARFQSPPHEGRNGEARTPEDGPTANILMVDDRADKLLALEAILAPLGQNLVKARSGREALRCLLSQEFAVILLDVSMPGMDGFETAALIRARPKSETTPIIFVTAIGSNDTHLFRGYSLGAVDYLLTPIVPEVLRAKISVFVDLHRKSALIQRQAEELRRIEDARYREVSHLNRELEARLAALTEANGELEAFNYSIAHDLRTPLRSMSGFARALVEDESDNLSPLGQDYAKRIARSAKYMDIMLQDLLAYSGLARSKLKPVPISPEEPLREILTVHEKDIRDGMVHIEIASPLAQVLAHPPTFKQILANLVGNSLKFVAPEREPVIRIRTTVQSSFVRLWVEDNGIGIAPEHHERIFGLFQRLHDVETYPGTGIGLALVRKGVERMGGRVGVESRLGEGSRFWVDLPKADPTQDA